MNSPGPGGFGPQPAFQQAHPGVKLVPAQTTPRPGIHSGPSQATDVWPWGLLAALVAAVAVVGWLYRKLAR